jgi:hypothetical protein
MWWWAWSFSLLLLLLLLLLQPVSSMVGSFFSSRE